MNETLDQVIAMMSPDTLVSFIVDLEPQAGNNVEDCIDRATKALEFNVGKDAADKMLTEYTG